MATQAHKQRDEFRDPVVKFDPRFVARQLAAGLAEFFSPITTVSSFVNRKFRRLLVGWVFGFPAIQIRPQNEFNLEALDELQKALDELAKQLQETQLRAQRSQGLSYYESQFKAFDWSKYSYKGEEIEQTLKDTITGIEVMQALTRRHERELEQFERLVELMRATLPAQAHTDETA